MKKKIGLIIGLILLTGLLSIYSLSVFANEKPNISADDIKTKMNMDIAEYKDHPAISKEKAVEAAKIAFPEFAIIDNKNIKAQINKMTYKGFELFSEEAMKKNPRLKTNGYLENDPVWIVSFKGQKIRPSGPAGTSNEAKEKRVHEEENVVVDAIS